MNKYKLQNICRFVFGLPKSVRINFKYFPFKTAVKLPIWVSSHCTIRNLKGKCVINSKSHFGMIKIGFGNVGVVDYSEKSIFSNEGVIEFDGNANIGYASKIDNHGIIHFGNNFVITAKCMITCYKKIIFGNDVLISYETALMDTDTHKIIVDGVRVNDDEVILIGDKCWIGTRTTLLKGARLPSNSVLAAGSLLNRAYDAENIILAGVPAKCIKNNINWEI